jgi:hypothetical protein
MSMTATFDTAAAAAHAGRAVIAIELLTAHPGNVRRLSLASAEVSLTSITRILARPDAG